MNINISIRRLTAPHKLKLLLQDACRQLPIGLLVDVPVAVMEGILV